MKRMEGMEGIRDGALPPVRPVDRTGPPPAPIEGVELHRMGAWNRRRFERTHLKHVVEKEAERAED